MIRPAFLIGAVVALLAASAIARATAAPSRSAPILVCVEARGLQAATGFVVGDDRVVTVAHAVGDGPIVVSGSDGAKRPAMVVRRDDDLDLALLAVSGIDDSGRPPPRGHARVVVRRDGATAALPVNVRARIDARVRDAATDAVVRRPALEIAAPTSAGDSGAPVIGADGRVAGVIFGRSRDHTGVAYAVVPDSFLR